VRRLWACAGGRCLRDDVALVSEMKARGLSAAEAFQEFGARAAFCFAFYSRCMQACGLLDMDDLVPAAVEVLQRNPAAHSAVLG
jgi:superfamily I DNA/RNA helicase